MSGTRQPAPLLIAGAGVCGLASALALARAGVPCRVLEQRLDPAGRAGTASLEAAEQQRREAQALLADGGEAATAFARSARLRAKVWGTRQRNVLLDGWALAYLGELGVAIEMLPAIAEMAIDWGPGAPRVTARYAGPGTVVAPAPLSAGDLVFRRDWAAQPSLAQLELELYRACEAHPGVEVLFDCAIGRVESDENGVRLDMMRSGEAVSLEGRGLVIADGGGRHSLAHRFGMVRDTVYRESVQVAVFASTRTAPGAVGRGGLVAKGWAGIADNGDIATVQYAVPGVAGSPAAYAWGRAQGLEGEVLEYAADITSAIDRARDPAPAPAVWLAGDAAARGSPLFGLGAQYGVLWAQLLAGRAHDGAWQPRAASTATALRQAFESACMSALDDLVNARHRLSDWLTAPAVAACLDAVTLAYRPAAGGARLKLSLALDLSRLAGDPAFGAVRGLEHCRLSFEGTPELRGDGFRTVLESGDTLSFSSRLETIDVTAGTLAWSRGDDGDWRVSLEHATIRRRAPGGSSSERAFRVFELSLPAALGIGWAETVLERACGGEGRLPFSASIGFSLRAGASMVFGRSGVQAVRSSSFQLRFDNRAAGAARCVIDLSRGAIRPIGLTRAPLRSLAGLRRLDELTAGVGSVLADSAARLAARGLRRIEITLGSHGGRVVYTGATRLPVPLDAADLAALRRQILATLFAPRAPLGWRRDLTGLRFAATGRDARSEPRSG